jgi:hypothetical protein
MKWNKAPFTLEKPVKTEELHKRYGDSIFIWNGKRYCNPESTCHEGRSSFLWKTEEVEEEYPAIVCKCGCTAFELNDGHDYAQMAKCANCGEEDEVYSG